MSMSPPPPPVPIALAPLDPAGPGAGPDAPPAPARRSRASRLGLAAGIVALVAVAGAGLAAVLGGSNGASSPEAAVRRLADAAASEDILGAAQLLPPSEVGSATDLYDLAIRTLQKHDELGPAGKPLAGVDITVDDLRLETTRYGDRVAKVNLRDGRFGVKVTAAEVDPRIRDSQEDKGSLVTDSQQSVTVGELVDRIADASDAAADTGVGSGRISGLYLMTIEQQGRWYVSYQYTMLEYARELVGAELPTFGPRVAGEGASSPEAWLRDGVAAVNGLDADAIADRLEQVASQQRDRSGIEAFTSGAFNPAEVQAFADYLPVLARAFESLNGSLGRSGELGVDESDSVADLAAQIRGLDISIEVSAEPEVTRLSDDRALVALRSGSIDARVRGVVDGQAVDSTLHAEVYDGRCARWQFRSLDDRGRTQTDTGDECTDAFADTAFPGYFYAAVKVDGAWYLSPVETLVQYARFALEAELAR